MALEASTIAFADRSLLREQAYIDGEWCDADDGATFEVTNPATREVLGCVPRMGAAETAARLRPPSAPRANGRTGRPPSEHRSCARCAT